MIGHSLGGGRSDDNKLTISVRRRFFSERNRLFVQWLFYPIWLLPLTTAANLIVLIVEAISLSVVNRRPSLIRDIYVKSQLDAVSRLGTVRAARREVMRRRTLSFSDFFAPFTLIPQKLRLLRSSGLPRSRP